MPKDGNKIVPGQRFGDLTVEADSGERKNGYIVWRCRCVCGNLIDVDKRILDRGTAKDCGCKTKLYPGQRDITGQRFGMLTGEYCTGKRDCNGGYIWHMKCDCGGEIDVPLHQLTSGYRKSCGCLSHPPLKDWVGERFGRLTVVAYAGKWQGRHNWKCHCDCGNDITVNQSNLKAGHTRSCGCMQAEVYRDNLKLIDGTSVLLLERRRGKIQSANTSGYTGVYQQKRTGKWAAQITFKGKTYFLGTYEKKVDAIRARQRSEEMHVDFLNWYYREIEKSSGPGVTTPEGQAVAR